MAGRQPNDIVLRRELGLCIQAHRRRRGLTQGELALLIGHRVTAVQAWEQARASPELDTIIRIAHACDMTLSAFFKPLDGLRVPDRIPRPRKHQSAS